MDPVDALNRLGGGACFVDLLDLTTRRRLRAAVLAGRVVRIRKDRYVLPGVDRERRVAARYRGALALRSAALAHGWPVKHPPPVPEVAVPRGRRLHGARGARVVWLDGVDTTLVATPPLTTVLMCSRALPFDEALAIADSALRSGDVTATELVEAADAARGAGAARVRRVARHATPLAANPFESVLRALTLDLGLALVPQQAVVVAGRTVHPDLVDERHRVVLEADSWEWHTGREAHVRDCRRYNDLVAEGWLVLRFAWEDVMLDPGYVIEVLRLVYGPPGSTEVPRCEPKTA